MANPNEVVAQEALPPDKPPNQPPDVSSGEWWHTWDYQAQSNDPVTTVEFPMPLPALDAGNRIANGLGLTTLPDGYILEHPDAAVLMARQQELVDAQEVNETSSETPTPFPPNPPNPNPDPVPEPEPTPEPIPEPEPEPNPETPAP